MRRTAAERRACRGPRSAKTAQRRPAGARDETAAGMLSGSIGRLLECPPVPACARPGAWRLAARLPRADRRGLAPGPWPGGLDGARRPSTWIGRAPVAPGGGGAAGGERDYVDSASATRTSTARGSLAAGRERDYVDSAAAAPTASAEPQAGRQGRAAVRSGPALPDPSTSEPPLPCVHRAPPAPPPCAAPPRLTQLAGGRHGPAAGCSAGARTVAAAKPLPS